MVSSPRLSRVDTDFARGRIGWRRFGVKTSGARFMGKGDQRTRRGKVNNGSHGKTRPPGLKKKAAPAKKSTSR
ncbi:MAG: 30S ribosomal protein THX [Burkholderiales bacterium]